MNDETKDDVSRNLCRDESLELIKMNQKKVQPINIRILRKKYNHCRSLSEQVTPHNAKKGSTLNQLIGENTDSSDSTSEDRSVKIVEWSKNTSTSAAGSTSDHANEKYYLRSRNNDLMAHVMKQNDQIDKLQNEVEVLVDALKQKEEDMERVLESNSENENRLRQMAVIERDKLKLTLEIDTLKQVIQDQAESLESINLRQQQLPVGRSSTHFITGLEDGTSDDNYAKTLQQKIDELSRIIFEKDNEIKDLTDLLQIKDLGLMEFGKTVDETHRRQTHVEDELEAATREADKLKQMTNMLQDTVKIRNNELLEIKLKLEEEKEVTMTLKVEKKMMTEKYEDLAQQKASNDKTFMHLYDELIPDGKVDAPEIDSEENCSECEYSPEDGIEGFCYLERGQSIETITRKSKPTRAPPPVPRQPTRINNAEKIEAESGIMVEKESNEAQRLYQADYEYFLMCSIAVRMNLAEMYHKDEIMAVDSRKLWPACQISHIPMNQYYFFIEDALREEFGLPKLSYPECRSSERPNPAHCCIVM